MAAPHREAVQKQIQQDWANREYIEVITVSIKKITDFLNSFGKCTFNFYTSVKVLYHDNQFQTCPVDQN